MPIECGARYIGNNSSSNEILKQEIENLTIGYDREGLGTYIKPAFELINTNAGTYKNNAKKDIVIVLADGDFNDDYSNALNQLKKNVDEIYCIGFGDGSNYNESKLEEMSSNGICYYASDAATLLTQFRHIEREALGNPESSKTEKGVVTLNESTEKILVDNTHPIIVSDDDGTVLFTCNSSDELKKYGLTIEDGKRITWNVKDYIKNNGIVKQVPIKIKLIYYIDKI